MSLHHVAIGTARLPELSAFYQKIPGIALEKEWHAPDGTVRSVWLRSGESILMLERSQTLAAPRALVFSPRAVGREPLAAFLAAHETDRSEFTAYFSDPDGNRLGFSVYPQQLCALGL